MNLKIRTNVLQMLAIISLAAEFAAFAQPADSTSFASFQIISQRNIFNPDRYPIRGNRPRVTHTAGAPTFSFAGTMSYRKGMFAFFSGNNSDYQKALQAGGNIAGYTVTKIGWDKVELESSGTNFVQMKVGAAMQMEGDAWQLVDSSASSQPIAPADESESGSTSPPSSEAPAPNLSAGNDILKRLMQQRQQEESK